MENAPRMTAVATDSRPIGWRDGVMILFVAGLVFAVTGVAGEWLHPLEERANIQLSASALPLYALYSLSRGLLAFGLSLIFSVAVGYWAARDARAGRLILPALDVLQSIPVLGFLPGFVFAMIRIFPSFNAGLEFAAILMIFTAQVWNLTFSFYQSLKAIPAEHLEISKVYQFSPMQRARWIEIPNAMNGLVWNSMVSVASGWFFLTVNESFQLGTRDFRLPGVGSYMALAIEKHDHVAAAAAVATMISIIIFLDQLLWRPLLCWSRKFNNNASTEGDAKSWFYEFLRQSRLANSLGQWFRRRRETAATPSRKRAESREPRRFIQFTWILYILFLGAVAAGVWQIVRLLIHVRFVEWLGLARDGIFTLARVLAATILSTLWTLPAGIVIGRSPRLTRRLQPWIQIASAFPAPMLFPVVILLFQAAGVDMNFGSVILMMLGAQWYILFNVVAGAAATPQEFTELGTVYRFTPWQRWKNIYLPAVFPWLVTGWVTAAGGAWNASIVSEFVMNENGPLFATGLGATVRTAAENAQFPLLAAAVIAMAAIVLLWNGTVWHYCYKLATRRFSTEK